MIKKLAALVLAVVLLVSVGSNVVLLRALRGSYTEMLRVQLDPTNARAFVDPPAKQQGITRVVLLGDSRIASWSNLPTFPNLEYVNRGVPGETSAQLAARAVRDAVSIRADIAIIATGINDLKAIGVMPKDAKSIEEHCVQDLNAIVMGLRKQEVKVILSTVWPAGKVELWRRPFWSDDIRGAIARVNNQLRAVGGNNTVTVDFGDILSEKGDLAPAVALDTWHVNSEGYRRLNERIAPVIERLAAAPK